MEHYDAFISYRRTDLHTAEVIRMKLETKGVHCFMDKHAITGGEEWEQMLYENIQAAPNFICFLTEDATKQAVQLAQSRTKDYFRQEVKKALDCHRDGKRILSVLCNAYRFPNRWDDDMPQEIRRLKRLQAIEFIDTEMDASIERIITDMKDLTPISNRIQYRSDGEGFIEDVLDSGLSVTTGCFMFHAGADWFKEVPRRDKLERIVSSGIKLRVLLNTKEAAMILAQHMTHPGLRYTSFEDSISDWIGFSKDNPEQVEVRISSIPILRRMYMFSGDDSKHQIMRVSYYTYQGMDVKKNCCQILSAEQNKEYFTLYQNEFEYLWDKAADV